MRQFMTRPDAVNPGQVLHLQRAIGNRAVSRLIAGRRAAIQAKLTVGAADDPYEREADRVATQVMSANAAGGADVSRQEDETGAQRKAAPSITPLAQRREVDMHGSFDAGEGVEQQLSASKSSGKPLPSDLRAQFEPRFGADFNAVRVHTGSQSDSLSRSIGAQAFTHSNHIYMAEGAYNPGSAGGKHLLAHELTHVVQQGGANQVHRSFKSGMKKLGKGLGVGAKWGGGGLGMAAVGALGVGLSPIIAPVVGGMAIKHGVDKARGKADPYKSLNAVQFRVSKFGIQQVQQAVDDQGEPRTNKDGSPMYAVVGIVDRNSLNTEGSKLPEIEEVDPVPLPEWKPKVTHINGMAVKPKSGLKSAQTLFDQLLAQVGGDGVDILYTYSSSIGFFGDVMECLDNKLGIGGEATKQQEKIMLNAVKTRTRVVVSAHSRGTIKSDNAVGNAFKHLMKDKDGLEYMWKARLRLREQPKYAKSKKELPKRVVAKQMTRMITEDMNKYIKLIYAGNAVMFPSQILSVDLFANKFDPVSFFVGSYYTEGTKHKNARTHRGSGKGHGFAKEYTKDVATMISGDIAKHGTTGTSPDIGMNDQYDYDPEDEHDE
ncbi:MAG: DUF4157 domain-containing protein [Chloroflexi bacterium]|nr:DUF4157 domain-containing protein [Chloroflexota bacterium]MCL5274834.1 DUF4157 domain-containing protein [Chloroflexota bacterium]